MSSKDDTHITVEARENDEAFPTSNEDPPSGTRPLEKIKQLLSAHPVLAPLMACFLPVGFCILFPYFWVQLFCILWGITNLTVFLRYVMGRPDISRGQQIAVNFAAILSVTQIFGAAYSATLLSDNFYEHFNIAPNSKSADYVDRRLALGLVKQSHQSAIAKLSIYMGARPNAGHELPNDKSFSSPLRRQPCPDRGIASMVAFQCDVDQESSQPFAAKRLLPSVLTTEKQSEGVWLLRRRGLQPVYVAISDSVPASQNEANSFFWPMAGQALVFSVYRTWGRSRPHPTTADRRALIEYLANLARSRLSDPDRLSGLLLETGSNTRFETAIAEALLCAQIVNPRPYAGPCPAEDDFARLRTEDGWDSPNAQPGVLKTALRPLDYLFQAYLTEIIYWDIQALNRPDDRRDLVVNGMVFSAMATMTSGFADLSPQSYLAKFLLIMQFFLYVLIILLVLPMSMERPRDP